MNLGRRKFIQSGLGAAALLLSGANGVHAQGKNGAWLDDYAAAKAESRKTGKPIFLVFR